MVNHSESSRTSCQFHKHFKSSFYADILEPKSTNLKWNLKSFTENVGEIDACCLQEKLNYTSVITQTSQNSFH